VPLPGGEHAVREPWRMALSHLLDADCANDLSFGLLRNVEPTKIRTTMQMIERGFNAPMTSSAGRLFDAAAVLAGVRNRATFEGQSAMELEWHADAMGATDAYPFEVVKEGDRLVVDTRPLIRAIVEDRRASVPAAVIARCLHSTIAAAIVATCLRIRETTGIEAVVLSGGVFQNRILSEETAERLVAASFQVYRHERVPPNDGGLALGQLAIAAARGEASECA
jgi:hydrogenase maturation protein HypF